VLTSVHLITECSLLQVIVPADRVSPSSICSGVANLPGP
jgi:hypothetical protein